MTDQTVVQQPAPDPPPKSRSEIASELFGKDFHGEVEKPAPVEKTEEEPKPDDAKDGEALEDEVEGEQETDEPEAGEETAPEGTGETPIATVSELVEHLEADPKWFEGLKMTFNVDGTPTEATIGQLVESYQLDDAARHRLEAAKTIAQKEREVWSAKQQELEGQFQVAAQLIQTAEAALDRDVKAVDPKLRDEDPAEWAARVQEFQQRRGFINKMKFDAVAAYKTHAEKKAAEFKQSRQQYADQQREVLLDKLPEWRDTDRATAEQTKLIDYLYNEGFDRAELENLIDHRQLLLARKAMLYDESRGQVDTAKKRVAKVPKIMRSGAPKSKDQLSSEKLLALKARLEKTGTLEDAMAYRMAKRGVSR